MDQLMDQIEIVGGSIQLPPGGELDPQVVQLVDLFEQQGVDIVDAVSQDQSTSQVEQWYLNDGNIGDLLDALDNEAQQSANDVADLVDQYFGDQQLLVEYIEEATADLVTGDLVVLDIVVAEGAGSILCTVIDDDISWQLVIGDNPELQELITIYSGKNVLVDGEAVSGDGDLLDVSSIVLADDLKDLAAKLAWVDAQLANILLNLLN